jgi:hypothetical protein
MAAISPISLPAPKWKLWHTLCLFIIIIATALICFLLPLDLRLWSWLGSMVLLTLFVAIAGHGVTGYWRGALIDGRNKISLSRLQTALWTLVILSAFLTAALINVRSGQVDPLSIALPTGIWILLGISTTSLVGSPLILNNKKSRPADPQETARNLDLLKNQNLAQPDAVINQGQVIVNTSPENASWADLFRGEETGNAGQFDMGKIQLFYFTFILVLVYAVALGTLFLSQAKIISAFPDLGTGELTLLGISHAGYLINKTIPHSQG